MSRWDDAVGLVEAGKIPFTLNPRGDGFEAVVTIPLADGRMILCRGMCGIRQAAQSLGYDYEGLAGDIGDELIAGLVSEGVGAEVPMSPAEFAWRGEVAKKLGKSPDDTKAMDAWWKSLAVTTRKRARATYAAIASQAPKGLDYRGKVKWWQSQGKDARVRMREKYGGYGGSILRDIGKTAMAAAKVTGSVLEQIPVYGPIMAETAKGLANAGVFEDPLKLGMLALNSQSMAYLATTKKGKLVPSVKAVGRQLKVAAKSQAGRDALLKAGEVLSNPEIAKQVGKIANTKLGGQLNAAITASKIVRDARNAPTGSSAQKNALHAARRALSAFDAQAKSSAAVRSALAVADDKVIRRLQVQLAAPNGRDVRRYVVALSKA